jgi:hypothetical protein
MPAPKRWAGALLVATMTPVRTRGIAVEEEILLAPTAEAAGS